MEKKGEKGSTGGGCLLWGNIGETGDLSLQGIQEKGGAFSDFTFNEKYKEKGGRRLFLKQGESRLSNPPPPRE